MATSSSVTAFLTVEKSFTYRGVREHWSNAYHLDSVPVDAAAWGVLADLIMAGERSFLPADTQIEGFLGHAPGTPPVLVYEGDVPPTGEGGADGLFVPSATAHPTPGDAAVFVRYSTTQKSSLGKPIYLWNYYHGVYYDAAAPDTQDAQQKAALDLFAANWVAGQNVGAPSLKSYRRAGPRGAIAQGHKVSDFITTRTLKHRGRRHAYTGATANETRLQKLVDGLIDLNDALKPPTP